MLAQVIVRKLQARGRKPLKSLQRVMPLPEGSLNQHADAGGAQELRLGNRCRAYQKATVRAS